MAQTPLFRLIADEIASEGPIGLDRYMALCLGHPVHGYYRTRDPLGLAGDFTTAPEISQMFGELIGVWVADTWARMGAPSPCLLVELGPGRGTLMADALRALATVAPGTAFDVHLVETSPVLRATQEARLAPQMARPSDPRISSPPGGGGREADGGGGASGDIVLPPTPPRSARSPSPKGRGEARNLERQARARTRDGATIAWHERIETLPEGPAIVIANEFFDALPVRQFQRTEDGWRERRVGLESGRLRLGLAPEPEPGLTQPGPPGAVLTLPSAALALVRALSRRIVRDGGALLAIDYGCARPGFGDTFQAVSGHRFADPFAAPGEADLTTHVDFSALARAATMEGAGLHGPAGQGDFLRAIGLNLRAERLKASADAAQAAAIDVAAARLTDPGRAGMGRLFKVLAVSEPGLGALAGLPAP